MNGLAAAPLTRYGIEAYTTGGLFVRWPIVSMEMGGPNGLLRTGWTRNSMKPGDVVTVEGFRARNGTPNGNATAVVLTSTGQRLFAASSQGQQ
jgi:hypothetical protein